MHTFVVDIFFGGGGGGHWWSLTAYIHSTGPQAACAFRSISQCFKQWKVSPAKMCTTLAAVCVLVCVHTAYECLVLCVVQEQDMVDEAENWEKEELKHAVGFVSVL